MIGQHFTAPMPKSMRGGWPTFGGLKGGMPPKNRGEKMLEASKARTRKGVDPTNLSKKPKLFNENYINRTREWVESTDLSVKPRLFNVKSTKKILKSSMTIYQIQHLLRQLK